MSFQKQDIQHASIKIGIVTWPGFCSAMVGQEKGFFGDNIKIEHKILDDSEARHAAFQSGTVDIMISSLDVFAQEYAQGLKGEVFLVTDESWGSDGIVVKDEINSATELKGKNIAYARATPSQFLLYKVLLEQGLTFDSIKQTIVNDPSLAAQAFLGGSVDAAVTWEPFLSEVKERKKGKILVTSADFPDVIIDVLVCNEKFAQNPELIKEFITGWLKSVDFIKHHPEEASQIIAKGLNVKGEDITGMMAGLKFADKQANERLFQTKKLDEVFEAAFEFWKSQGIIEKNAKLKNAINKTAIEYFNSGN
jgi:NitT/TauT family transport system substrate-binding protein